MFRASFLLIIRRINTTNDYTSCCLYTVDLPDDEQQACSKHVQTYYWNKVTGNSAYCWFVLYGYIKMHGQQNIKHRLCSKCIARNSDYYNCVLHSFISIQPYRPGWQEPEPSHVTGMALAYCILGKFLGVVRHCFPPPFLDVLTFAARCLYVRNDARDPSSERWNCGREIVR